MPIPSRSIQLNCTAVVGDPMDFSDRILHIGSRPYFSIHACTFLWNLWVVCTPRSPSPGVAAFIDFTAQAMLVCPVSEHRNVHYSHTLPCINSFNPGDAKGTQGIRGWSAKRHLNNWVSLAENVVRCSPLPKAAKPRNTAGIPLNEKTVLGT